MIGRTIQELPDSMTYAQYTDTEIGPDQMIGLRRRAATRTSTRAQPAVFAAAPVPVLVPATLPSQAAVVAAAGDMNRSEERESNQSTIVTIKQ